MTGYSIIYIILALILLGYSSTQKFDLLSVAAVCYVVYTMYCIPGIGVTGYYRISLSPDLYYAVYAQMILILVFLLIARSIMKKKELYAPAPVKYWPDDDILRLSFRAYTAVIAAFALYNIASAGIGAFTAGKLVVWERTNVFYVISLYGAWPSFAYGIHKKDKMVWIPSLLVELTIFFAGSRAFTATMILLFLCEMGEILWKSRKDNKWIYILAALCVVFLLLYRMIDQAVMMGDFDTAMAALREPMTWLTALEFNEPRVIIGNYDYSFTSGMHYPIGDVIYRIIDFIPGLTAAIPIRLMYPEYYSAWLMQQVGATAGVGASIWGECYVMAGYGGILLFTLIWLLFLYKCNSHLNYHESYSYFIAALGIYHAWYISRLDFNMLAQSCKVMLFCFLIWAAAYITLGGCLKIGNIVLQKQ